MKSYSELIELKSFEERLAYLKLLDNNVSSPRHMSGDFYKSNTWQAIRRLVINRDLSFDLGVFGVYIPDSIIVHHINPITVDDIIYQTPKLTDLENLITTSIHTHNLIHYNTKEKEQWVERTENDTSPWKEVRSIGTYK
jgi:hypothetical protein